MKRYLYDFIKKDLPAKAIILSGPRQVGKTTLAKSLFEAGNFEYLNYDILNHRKVIISQSWNKATSLVVLGELHKLKKWKNYLKGVIDEFQNTPPLLITGSARLEVFRRAGDALTGRTISYHLYPIDLSEALKLVPERSLEENLSILLNSGGFLESFFNPELSSRLFLDRITTVFREDLRDLSQIVEIKKLELLVELLRERVGGAVVNSNLANDLLVSAPTIKNWIDILEKLYLIFLVRPFAGNLAKGLRKEAKCYFFDCSAAINGESARLENLVAVSLLKYCELEKDSKGRELSLYYYRDSSQREVDFVILERRKVLACIEVKTSDDYPSGSLKYVTERLKPKHSIQLVRNLKVDQDFGEIKIRSLGAWLANIEL